MISDDVASALHDVQRRLEDFLSSADPSVLLSSSATQALETIEAAIDGDADLYLNQAAGWMRWHRYVLVGEEQEQEQAEITSALELFRPVYHIQPEAVPLKLREVFDQYFAQNMAQHNAALDLLEEFQTSGDLRVLYSSVELLRVTSAKVSGTDRESSCLSNLSYALRIVFDFTHKSDFLDEAIAAARAALESTDAGSDELANILVNLGNALHTLHELTGDAAVLAECVDVYREAAEAAPEGHPDRVSALSGLAVGLSARYSTGGELEDLDDAIRQRRLSVAALDQLAGLPRDYGLDEAAVWFGLGTELHSRYQRTGRASDLHEAIEILERARDLTGPSDPYLPFRYHNLSNCLNDLHELFGDLYALHRAVDLSRAANQLVDDSHPGKGIYLSSLCSALSNLFREEGRPQELIEAIDAGRRAIKVIPPGHSSQGAAFSNLGNALLEEYKRTGDQAILHEAVETGRAAVKATSARGSSRAAHLANLAMSLALYADVSGAGALTEAIQACRTALAIEPTGSPAYALYQANLSGMLVLAHRRGGLLDLLSEAIDLSRDSLAQAPAGSNQIPSRMDALASALRMWHDKVGDQDALLEALSLNRQALLAVNRESVHFGPYLMNLGATLHRLFLLSRDVTAMALAVEFARRAALAFPPDSPYRPTALFSIARGLELLTDGETAPTLLTRTMDAYTACMDAQEGTGAGILPITTAHRMAVVAMKANALEPAADAVEMIVALLPQTAGRAFERVEREYRLQYFNGLSYNSAGIMLANGRPERAVEIIEATRGMLLGEAAEEQRSLARLRDAAPDLAAKLESLIQQFSDTDHQSTAQFS
ncbi:hypothetical protein ACSDR0_45670 [Streptosporangium sp. G11]|uniref:hypothetical protein n=1 Tax=Streptosporangium sp. G11 TaxID=3436926 RepID=UPI003EB8FD97